MRGWNAGRDASRFLREEFREKNWRARGTPRPSRRCRPWRSIRGRRSISDVKPSFPEGNPPGFGHRASSPPSRSGRHRGLIGLARSLQPWLRFRAPGCAGEQAVVSGRPEVQRAAPRGIGAAGTTPSTPRGWMRILEATRATRWKGIAFPVGGGLFYHRVLNRGGFSVRICPVVSRGSSGNDSFGPCAEPSPRHHPSSREHRVETREGRLCRRGWFPRNPGTARCWPERGGRSGFRKDDRSNDPSAVSPMPEGYSRRCRWTMFGRSGS